MLSPLVQVAICQLIATAALCNTVVCESIASLTEAEIDELITVAHTCHEAAKALDR
jgi:hypothetical protein